MSGLSTRAERERKHFDRLADEVGEAGSHRTTKAGVLRMHRRGRLIAGLLAPLPDPLVLEIGAGAGAFSRFILEEAPELRLVGCDISPRCIAIAKERYAATHPHTRFDVADCTAFEYNDNTFDCVCGCSILHHLPLDQVLKECYRVLKPNRHIWFSEPNMMNPQIMVQKNVPFIKRWLEDTEDETAFFRWGMARALRNAGFTEVAVRPFDFLHPSLPVPLTGLMDLLGRSLERIPLLREIAGSLVISAKK